MANSGSILFQTLSDQALAKLTYSVTGSSLVEAILQDGGLFNTTYRLILKDGRKMILRVGPIHPERLMYYEKDMMSAEAFLFRQMEQAGIPGSHVVALGKIEERDYMMVDYIDSVPLSACKLTDGERSALMKELAAAMTRLHTMRGIRYGRVSEVLQGRGFEDWYAHVLNEVTVIMRQGVEMGSFTSEEAEQVIDAVLHCREALEPVCEPVLCHGDLWDGNILIHQREDGWHLAAIIDVDRAVYGDVDFDLGNPWMGVEDGLIQPKDCRERRIRREVYSMMYFIFEAHVWHMQYCNEANAQRGKEITMKKAELLLTDQVR